MIAHDIDEYGPRVRGTYVFALGFTAFTLPKSRHAIGRMS